MIRILKAAAMMVCLSLLLAASEVDGVWKAEYTSPDGNQRQSTFHLKADGNKLTGKVVGGTGEAPLKDGIINGDDVAFSVVRNFGGNDVTLKYKGKVLKDEIRLNVTFNDNSFDIIAKRQH